MKKHQSRLSLFPNAASQTGSPTQNVKQPQASMALSPNSTLSPKPFGIFLGPIPQRFLVSTPQASSVLFPHQGELGELLWSCTQECEPCTRLLSQQTGDFCKYQKQLDSAVTLTVSICQQFHLSKQSPPSGAAGRTEHRAGCSLGESLWYSGARNDSASG